MSDSKPLGKPSQDSDGRAEQSVGDEKQTPPTRTLNLDASAGSESPECAPEGTPTVSSVPSAPEKAASDESPMSTMMLGIDDIARMLDETESNASPPSNTLELGNEAADKDRNPQPSDQPATRTQVLPAANDAAPESIAATPKSATTPTVQLNEQEEISANEDDVKRRLTQALGPLGEDLAAQPGPNAGTPTLSLGGSSAAAGTNAPPTSPTATQTLVLGAGTSQRNDNDDSSGAEKTVVLGTAPPYSVAPTTDEPQTPPAGEVRVTDMSATLLRRSQAGNLLQRLVGALVTTVVAVALAIVFANRSADVQTTTYVCAVLSLLVGVFSFWRYNRLLRYLLRLHQ